MRCLIYAVGGGAGHFTRALAISLQLLSEQGMTVWLIHSCPLGRLFEGWSQKLTLTYLKNEPTRPIKVQNLLGHLLSSEEATVILVDTFVWGINGELRSFLAHRKTNHWWVFLFRRTHLFIEGETKGVLRAQRSPYDLVVVPNHPSIRHVGDGTIGDVPLSYSSQIVLTPELWNQHQELPLLLPKCHQLGRSSGDVSFIHVTHTGKEPERFFLNKQAAKLKKMVEREYGTTVSVREFTPQGQSVFPGFVASMSGNFVVGGAGYNLLNETFVSNTPILAYPFKRGYDDQFGRLISWFENTNHTILTSSSTTDFQLPPQTNADKVTHRSICNGTENLTRTIRYLLS